MFAKTWLMVAGMQKDILAEAPTSDGGDTGLSLLSVLEMVGDVPEEVLGKTIPLERAVMCMMQNQVLRAGWGNVVNGSACGNSAGEQGAWQ